MLFDSHAHLESPRFDSDLGSVIERARSARVTRIMTCGSDLATSTACVEIAHNYSGVYAAAGIHPHEARTLGDGGDALDPAVMEQSWDQIRAWAHRGEIVAVGEIGLDYHYDFSPRAVQQAALSSQLALAEELDLPVILHNRESDEDLKRIVESGPPRLRGVLHCFMGGASLADWALSRGLYLGVAGPVTFKNADDVRDLVRTAPLERLLVETDSPYLAPHPHRGERNEPAHVRRVAERVANIRGLSVEQLARITTDNALRLFGVP
ncbi:MAG: TatD family hydrolase [Anaerolineae bacterium]